MKLQVGVVVALALVSGPAAAQSGWGPKPKQNWAPGGGPSAPSAPRSYGVAPAPSLRPSTASPSQPKTYGAPEASTPPAFKPYQGSSTYSGRGSTTSLFGPDGKKKP